MSSSWCPPCQSEIGDLWNTLVNQDIFRLHIPVHHSPGHEQSPSRGALKKILVEPADNRPFVLFEAFRNHGLPQGRTRNVLHDDIVQGIAVHLNLIKIIDLEHIGMAYAGHHLDLTPEKLQFGFVFLLPALQAV